MRTDFPRFDDKFTVSVEERKKNAKSIEGQFKESYRFAKFGFTVGISSRLRQFKKPFSLFCNSIV